MCARSRRRSIAGVVGVLLLGAGTARAQAPDATRLHAAIDRATAAVMDSVISWRRDFHQHPELSNREVRTSGIVAAHLRSLGLEVRTGVAHTGVIGVLRGGRPGPVVIDIPKNIMNQLTAYAGKQEVRRASYNPQTLGDAKQIDKACGKSIIFFEIR